MRIDREKAKQAGYSDAEIDAYEAQLSQPQPEEKSGGILDFVKGASNFVAPRATNLLSNPSQGLQPIKPSGPLSYVPNPLPALGAAGELSALYLTKGKSAPGVSMAGRFGLGGILHGGTGEGSITNRATNAVLEGGAGYLGGKVLEKVLPIIKYPTKNRAANAATKEAQKATQEGKGIHWDNLQTQIRDRVKEKLGDTVEIRQLTNKLLSEKTPAAIQPTIPNPGGVGSSAGSFNMAPSELLDWRRQIARRGGKTFFEKMFTSSNLDQKVEQQARSVITKEIHKLAPKTLSPDKAFSLYSQPGNTDIPGWAKRIIVGEVARRYAGPQLGSFFSKFTGGQ